MTRLEIVGHMGKLCRVELILLYTFTLFEGTPGRALRSLGIDVAVFRMLLASKGAVMPALLQRDRRPPSTSVLLVSCTEEDRI